LALVTTLAFATPGNAAGPPAYHTTFADSFEGPTFPQVFNLGAWRTPALVDGSGYVSRITPSGYSATNGTRVMESHVDGTGTRAELQCDSSGSPLCAGGEGSEFFYEYDVRVASGQTISPGDGSAIEQTKPSEPSGGGDSCYGGALLAQQVVDTSKVKIVLRVRGGVPTATGNGCTVPTDRVFDLGNYSRNAWHHVALHARWSTSASIGFDEVWIDGVNVLPKTFLQNFLGQGRIEFFRIGIYITPNALPLTFQYDDVRIGVPYGDTLNTNETLPTNQSLISQNGQYRLIPQLDGNLVEYGSGGPVWATGTSGSNVRLVMQLDGNLVLYDGANHALWATNRFGSGARLVVQNDSNLVVYSGSGSVIWSRW
jgi:hypothetical protein